jgi:hypothetical protein
MNGTTISNGASVHVLKPLRPARQQGRLFFNPLSWKWKERGKRKMSDWMIWFMFAGVLVILEIATGTFYLLMLGIGLAAAGLAALGGAGRGDAVNLKVAEQYVGAFSQLAKANNSIIVPANLSDISGLIASAMQVVKSQQPAIK